MQKLNNKGLTLIELIVSVTLVSIVLIFLTRLLSNVTYESDNEFFASENQEERIEITDYINSILRKYEVIYDPTVTSLSPRIEPDKIDPGTTSVTIFLKQNGYGPTQIVISKNRIQVKNSATILRTWDLKTGFIQLDKVICTQGSSVSSGGYIAWKCNIPIYTINDENNVDNNNTLDDITLSFLAKMKTS